MHKLLISGGAFFALAACQSYGDKAGNDLQAEIAQNQGPEVSQICFAESINGWRALGDRAVLLEKGANEWYQVNLSGPCEPEWAFNAIAIETRGSSCLTKGDKIHAGDSLTGNTCWVTDIHEWNEPRHQKNAH